MPVLLTLLVCALLAGCARKKPVLVMPQEPPPATAPTPAPAPQAQQQPSQSQPQPSQAPEQEGQATNEGAQKTRPKPHPAVKKPSPQTPAGTTTARNNKTVINDGGVSAPVAPAPSPEQARQQAATEQLLQSTENAIKGITRQLSPEEQAMLAQIRDFVSQSRSATKDNDFTRAHNLAVKAHLLSDELVKQK